MRSARQPLIWVSAISLAFTSFALPISSAVPTSKQSCEKKGQIKVSNGATYKCTLISKRLKWKLIAKRVAAPTSTNNATPTPTPTVAPSPTPSPTSSTTNATPIPTPTVAPSPLETITKEYADYLARKKRAYLAIRSVAVPASEIKFNLDYKIGAGYPKELRDFNLAQVAYSARVFSYFLDKKIDTSIYLYTEKESQELRSMKYWRQNSWWDDGIQPWFDRWSKGIATEHNIGLAAWYIVDSDEQKGHAGIAAASTATVSKWRIYNLQVMPHEFFHVIQDYHFRSKGLKFHVDHDTDEYATAFPPMFREGSANTISIAVTFEDFEQYLNFYAIEARSTTPRLGLLNTIRTESDVVVALSKITRKSSHPDAHEASYFVGALLFEWFISEYGIDKYRALMTDPGYGGSFNELLKKVIGIDSAELYKRAAGHILSGLKNR